MRFLVIFCYLFKEIKNTILFGLMEKDISVGKHANRFQNEASMKHDITTPRSCIRGNLLATRRINGFEVSVDAHEYRLHY